MGIKRWFWRSTSVGLTVDIVRNIIDEGSVLDGIKRTTKETIYEDAPIVSQIYQNGKTDGKKEGYITASNEYEKKLLEQADHFLQQVKIYVAQRNDYENLLNEYEKEIGSISSRLDRTEDENRFLLELLLRQKKLLNIKLEGCE